MKTLNKIALTLCIIGGINWGAIGFFQFDIVAWIFGGQDSAVSRIIYALVFIGAIWSISLFWSNYCDENPDPKIKDKF